MKRALLVIDVQNEYFTGRVPVTHPQGSFANILLAMDEAAKQGIPVIVIQHTNGAGAVTFVRDSDGWAVHPEVLARPYECIIEKKLPGSFTGTDLEAALQRMGVDTVTICGYMTQMCCDTTSRQAVHMGYQVEFLSDATGTLDIKNYAGSVTAEELHRAILVTQAMRFSRVMSTQDWIKSLQG